MSLLIEVLFFLAIVLFVLGVYMIFVFYKSDISFNEWLNGGIAKGAGASAALGIGVTLLFIVLASLLPNNANAQRSDMFTDVKYLNYVEVYLGIDYTKGTSPQCKEGGVDDRGTSNLGVRVNLIEWQRMPLVLNQKLTHHSCVLGKDTNGYDAFFGVELVYTPWRRK
jgi:uncharacterized membrane protein (DUF485 family)